jgi:hypothetical protein
MNISTEYMLLHTGKLGSIYGVAFYSKENEKESTCLGNGSAAAAANSVSGLGGSCNSDSGNKAVILALSKRLGMA